jgi:hypothetical protein
VIILVKVTLAYMLSIIASGEFYHFHKHVSNENFSAAWVYLIWWQIAVPWMGK